MTPLPLAAEEAGASSPSGTLASVVVLEELGLAVSASTFSQISATFLSSLVSELDSDELLEDEEDEEGAAFAVAARTRSMPADPTTAAAAELLRASSSALVGAAGPWLDEY